MRFIVTFLMLLAGLGFGIGNANASPTGKRVALLSMANTNPWVSAWTSSFVKEAEARGMKVTNLTSPYDAAQQSQQVDDAIAQKYDLIAIEYDNDQAIVPALTRAKAAGMPVVLWATPLEKKHENLFCLMSAPTTSNSAASRPKTWSRRLPTRARPRRKWSRSPASHSS